jgi:hypothetical protein
MGMLINHSHILHSALALSCTTQLPLDSSASYRYLGNGHHNHHSYLPHQKLYTQHFATLCTTQFTYTPQKMYMQHFAIFLDNSTDRTARQHIWVCQLISHILLTNFFQSQIPDPGVHKEQKKASDPSSGSATLRMTELTIRRLKKGGTNAARLANC